MQDRIKKVVNVPEISEEGGISLDSIPESSMGDSVFKMDLTLFTRTGQ